MSDSWKEISRIENYNTRYNKTQFVLKIMKTHKFINSKLLVHEFNKQFNTKLTSKSFTLVIKELKDVDLLIQYSKTQCISTIFVPKKECRDCKTMSMGVII